jgi:acyl-CoA thioesterase
LLDDDSSYDMLAPLAMTYEARLTSDRSAEAHPFDTATEITPIGDGRWTSPIDQGWFTPNGPNGGYLAAIVLRAVVAAAGEAPRSPRSLTLHYLRPPQPGIAVLAARVEKAGRTATFLTARMEQDGRPCVLAQAMLADDFVTGMEYSRPMPSVRSAEEIEPAGHAHGIPEVARRFEARPAIGAQPFRGADRAVTGGWIAFNPPRRIDSIAIAMLTDAWIPAPFVKLTQPNVSAPTVDLTIHFRNPAPLDDGPVLGIYESQTSAHGYFEEDGTLWSRDGTLLAQSRQLALLR